MRIRSTIHKHYTCILLAALFLQLPMLVHAQVADQSPVEKPAGVPKIVFESLAYDFGTVQPNTPLTHSFVFTNQGTAPLLIEKVKAG
jgi:hypothetical protein